MSTAQDAIQRLQIETTSDGTDEATSSLNKLAEAYGGVAVASSETEKATTSLDSKFASIERRYVDGVKAQQDYAKVQSTVNAAVSQNPALQDRANVVLAAAKQRYEDLSGSQSAYQKSLDAIKDKASDLSRELGPLGSALNAIGPAGLAIGAAIGVAVLALNALKDQANEAGQWASQLQNAANIIDLNTTQLQGLNEAAAKVGVSANDNITAFERFSVSLGQLRDGSGNLRTELLKVNPTLVSQLSVTKDAATGWNLLAQAYAQADKQQRALIARGAFGRGGAAEGGVLLATANAGGITGLQASNEDAISQEQIKRWADLTTQINSATEAAQHNFQSIFTTQILESEKAFADNMLNLSRYAKEFQMSDDLKAFLKYAAAGVGGAALGAAGGALVGGVGAVPGAAAGGIAGILAAWFTGKMSTPGFVPAPAFNPSTFQSPANSYSTFQGAGSGVSSTTAGSLGDQAAAAKDLAAALGIAATATDKFNEKYLALQLAFQNGKLGAKESQEAIDAYNRALEGLNLEKATAQQNLHNAALGAGATVAEQVAAKNAALATQILQGAGLTDTQIANSKRLNQAQADGTFALQAQIDAMKVQAQTMGMSVGQAEAFSLVQTKINENLNAGRPALDGITDGYLRMAVAAGQTKQAAAQNAAQNRADFELQTVFLSDTEKQIAIVQQQLHGNDWKDFMNDGLSATLRITASLKDLKTNVEGFATELANGLLQGKSLMDSLASAATSLGQKLVDSGLKTLVDAGLNSAFSSLTGSASGAGGAAALTTAGTTLAASITSACTTGAAALTAAAATLPGAGAAAGTGISLGAADAGITLDLSGTGAGVELDAGATAAATTIDVSAAGAGTALAAGGAAAGAAIWGPLAAFAAIAAGIGLSIFGSSNSAKQAQKEAEDNWKRMTTDVVNFNEAAKGFNLGPLTQAVQSLLSSYTTIQAAALKANDYAAAADASRTFGAGVLRIVDEFKSGTQTLNPLQTAIKGLNDEAHGLEDTLDSLKDFSLTNQVGIALQGRMQDLVTQFRDTFIGGLFKEINTARNQGYINDISDAIGALNTNLAEAAQLQPGGGWLTDLSNQDFAAKAQAIVDGAQLTGDAFNALVAQFPILQGTVHAFVQAAVDSGDALAKATDSIQQKINTLQGKGYLNDVNGLLSDQASALSTGVSPALVSQYFQLQAQSIVDGAKLTGDAFNALITQFPQLADVVHAFSASLAADQAAIDQRIQGYADRLFAATTDTSTQAGALAAFDRQADQQRAAEAAAGGAAMVQLEAALAAERLGVIQKFTDQAAAAEAAAAQAATAAAQAAASRLQGYSDRLFAATNDSSTLSGALAAFDRKALQDRAAEIAAGGQDIVALEAAQAAERAQIVTSFADQATTAEKNLADARLAQMQRIQQYLDNLRGGSSSTLSPIDRLSAAESSYNSQLALARGGDANALSNITSYSQNVLDAARAYYASSIGYQNIFASIQADLGGLISGTSSSGGLALPTSPSSVDQVALQQFGNSTATLPQPANSNSPADAINALRAQVAALQAALVDAVQTNSKITAAASEASQETLGEIATATKSAASLAELQSARAA